MRPPPRWRRSSPPCIRPTASSMMRPSCMLTRRGKRRGQVAVVGDDDRSSSPGVELEQELDDHRRRDRVEVAGRLVGEHERRFADDRPGDRDPLALAARQLRRSVTQPVREPDAVERRHEPAAGARAAAGRGRRGRRPRCRRRRRPRADGTAGTRSRGARRAGPSAHGRTWRRRPRRRRRACGRRTGGRACRSRSAASTCPTPTARRPPPTRRRRRCRTTPASAVHRRRSRGRPVRPTRSSSAAGGASTTAAHPATSTVSPSSTSAGRSRLARRGSRRHRQRPVRVDGSIDDLDRVAALGQRQQRRHRHDHDVRRPPCVDTIVTRIGRVGRDLAGEGDGRPVGGRAVVLRHRQLFGHRSGDARPVAELDRHVGALGEPVHDRGSTVDGHRRLSGAVTSS